MARDKEKREEHYAHAANSKKQDVHNPTSPSSTLAILCPIHSITLPINRT
jgi:hypothetical protein